MFEQLLAKIARAFGASGLPHMVIGGQAVLLYGEPRLTEDVDVTLGAGVDALPDVLEIIQDANLTPLAEDAESFVRDTMVLPCADAEDEPYLRRWLEDFSDALGKPLNQHFDELQAQA